MLESSITLSEHQDSFKKRLFYKILMGLLTPLTGLLILSIVPRSLGPASYGVYTFLFSFFTAYLAFIEAGTSTCFYAKLSADPSNHRLIFFYIRLLFFFLIGSFLLLFLCYALNLHHLIWTGIDFSIIAAMLLLGVLNFLNDIVLKACDAKSLTVQAESYRFLNRLLMLAAVYVLYFLDLLSLKTFIFFQSFFFFFYTFFIWQKILKINLRKQYFFSLLSEDKILFKEFFTYSVPLFLSTAIFQGAQMLESWVLTHYAGHTQQGYFGLAMQFSTMALIFTGAAMPLMFKEFSFAASQNNHDRVQMLFQKSVKQLPFLAMVLSIFLAFNGEQIAAVFAGSDYKSANLTLSLMLLYPIHQAYGQLCNVSFFAFSKTKIHMNLSFLSVIISLPLSFYLLLPENMGGFFLGSLGQALKYLLVQFLISNLSLFFACRLCKTSFFDVFSHQISCFGTILFFGYFSSFCAQFLFGSSETILTAVKIFLFSGFFYVFLISFFIWCFPQVIAFNSFEAQKLKLSVKQQIKNFLKR